MSINGHLYCLALAPPTMTDDLKEVQGALEGRLLQVVMKNGNASKAFMPKGQLAYDKLVDDLNHWHSTGSPHIYSDVGQDERGNNVPFTVVLSDVAMIMLFPPPSGLAVPGSISLANPSPSRH